MRKQNALDRMITRERKAKYKYYKKLFKARDMASKHVKEAVTVNMVMWNFQEGFLKFAFAKTIAKEIVDKKGFLKVNQRPFSHATQVALEKLPRFNDDGGAITKPSMTIKPPMQPVTKKEPQPPKAPEPREVSPY